MTSRLNPYIHYLDNARDAMEHYQSVLGGVLTISTFGDMGMTGDEAQMVMHSQLELPNGSTVMASDTPRGWTTFPRRESRSR